MVLLVCVFLSCVHVVLVELSNTAFDVPHLFYCVPLQIPLINTIRTQPAHHLTYKIPMNVANDWDAEYSINIRQGYYHCSKRSVAFHYIKPPLMRRMHSILYGFCEEK